MLLVLLTVTSEDVCRNIRNVKLKLNNFFSNMRFIVMFVTAVCVLFLINKLRWPKKKNFYNTVYMRYSWVYLGRRVTLFAC